MEKVIKPGIGLGAVKFGMTREQVSEILGDPTEIDVFTDDESGANVESWHYDEDEASFAFDEEADWRLTTIAVSGDHYEFAEIKPIGMPIEQLITQLESAGFEGLEEDDEDDQVFYSFETGVNFWVEDGVVLELQWGPEINDEEEIIWPL